MVLDQQKTEVRKFNQATIEILTLANIKPHVFNQSVELFLIKPEDTVESLVETTKMSLFSLFTVEGAHSEIGFTEARTLLAEVTERAV